MTVQDLILKIGATRLCDIAFVGLGVVIGLGVLAALCWLVAKTPEMN